MVLSDPKTARIINRLRMLGAVRRSETISRADLSRELLINKVSISEIADQLIAEGLIEEAGKVTGAVGRRPTLLRICRDAAFVLGIDIGLKNTTMGVGNLAGDLVRFERRPTPLFTEPEDLARFASEAAARLLTRVRTPERIRGCAVTVHAGTDAEGNLVSAPDWGWEQVPLRSLIVRQLPVPVPVALDSNVRAMLLAERWFGGLEAAASVFYINWGQKIGAAQMAGSSILSVNSEFGHLPVQTPKRCFCGRSGCLEAAAGGWSLEREGNALLGTSDRTVRQLFRESEQVPELTELFCEAARSLGEAAAAAATIIAPDTIIVGGGLSGIDDAYFRLMNEEFYRRAAPHARGNLVITRSKLGDRAGLFGAIALALDIGIYKGREIDALAAAEGTLARKAIW